MKDKVEQLMNPKTNRGREFRDFAFEVFSHIENYTVPQYGDADWDNPENGDQMQSASLEDIQMNLKRYMNRMRSNARGKKESIRDLHKIAHYAAIVWGKYLMGEIEGEDIESIDINSETDLTKLLDIIKTRVEANSKIELLVRK